MSQYQGKHRIDPPRGRHRVWPAEWAVAPLLGASTALTAGAIAAIFLSGAADMFFAQQASVAAVATDPDAIILTRPSSQYYVLGINETLAPFDDVKVRQAAAFAIDRDALAEAQGFSGAAWQPLPPGSLGYSEELDSTYSFDPDKSRELLADIQGGHLPMLPQDGEQLVLEVTERGRGTLHFVTYRNM